jgi:NADPH-dependent 2,4-dienoyl-CoA reductase/sulfur reductase-like enzyme
VTREVWRRRVSGPPSRVIEVLAPLGPRTRLLYEAGPTGYALARAGAAAGIQVTVCAPGSVPRGPARELACFCWEAAVLDLTIRRPPPPASRPLLDRGPATHPRS